MYICVCVDVCMYTDVYMHIHIHLRKNEKGIPNGKLFAERAFCLRSAIKFLSFSLTACFFSISGFLQGLLSIPLVLP